MTDSTTIIVGAGIAGLYTAELLLRAGKQVRLLEARERIGGRLLSLPRAEAGIDLGATWFWPNESRVHELVAQLKLPVFEQHQAGDALVDRDDGVFAADGNPLDASNARRFVGGAAALAEGLLRGFRARKSQFTLQTGAVVEAVEVSADGVTVRTEAQSFGGSAVVLALPPALAVARISFSPQLPESMAKLAAATPIWMAEIVKAVARYEAPFWRESGLAGAAMSYRGPLGEIHDMSGPDGGPAALFGFGRPGPGVSISEGAVVEQFARLFGERARSPVEVLIQDWRTERFTTPIGEPNSSAHHLFGHPAFRQPTHGCIHWTSTESGRVAPGHIEGALEAAERTAGALLRA